MRMALVAAKPVATSLVLPDPENVETRATTGQAAVTTMVVSQTKRRGWPESPTIRSVANAPAVSNAPIIEAKSIQEMIIASSACDPARQ